MSKAGRLRRQSVGDVSALLGALFGFGTARGSQPVSAPAPHRGECAPACLADSERARGVVPGDEMLSSDWLQSPLSIGTPCAVCVAGPAEPAPRLRPAPAAGAVCVWVRGRSGGSGRMLLRTAAHTRVVPQPPPPAWQRLPAAEPWPGSAWTRRTVCASSLSLPAYSVLAARRRPPCPSFSLPLPPRTCSPPPGPRAPPSPPSLARPLAVDMHLPDVYSSTGVESTPEDKVTAIQWIEVCRDY